MQIQEEGHNLIMAKLDSVSYQVLDHLLILSTTGLIWLVSESLDVSWQRFLNRSFF